MSQLELPFAGSPLYTGTDDQPIEYKVVALRECPHSNEPCETPEMIMAYWKLHVPMHPYFNPECECMVGISLDARRRIKGHYLVGVGMLDTINIHPREVYRPAIVSAASAIVLVHNHPSGDSSPSESDIKVTRDLIRAGQTLKLELLDHVIVGKDQHTSMKSLGYFFA